MGFYEGVNLSLAYCDDCGQELEMDVPGLRQQNLTKIDRMNGYLSYSRVKGDTRLNESKMAEIAESKHVKQRGKTSAAQRRHLFSFALTNDPSAIADSRAR